MIAQNMPIADRLIGANYLFKLAKRDGMRLWVEEYIYLSSPTTPEWSTT